MPGTEEVGKQATSYVSERLADYTVKTMMRTSPSGLQPSATSHSKL